jgi:N-acetyl-anhydromuramoyl-L-alanine amidase
MPAPARFEVDVGRGLLRPARYVRSPNQDARPPGATLDLVVIHGISLPPGEFGGDWVERLFQNALPPDHHPFFRSIEGLRVSAHLFVRRDGEILQFVPFHARAWHAGASVWRHRVACNDYSIGIELEGDDLVPYEPVQYERLGAILPALRRAYVTLAADAVVGHSEVAPGRKTDPGPAFDWARLAGAAVGAR